MDRLLTRQKLSTKMIFVEAMPRIRNKKADKQMGTHVPEPSRQSATKGHYHKVKWVLYPRHPRRRPGYMQDGQSEHISRPGPLQRMTSGRRRSTRRKAASVALSVVKGVVSQLCRTCRGSAQPKKGQATSQQLEDLTCYGPSSASVRALVTRLSAPRDGVEGCRFREACTRADHALGTLVRLQASARQIDTTREYDK
jgi:hypothetical protein